MRLMGVRLTECVVKKRSESCHEKGIIRAVVIIRAFQSRDTIYMSPMC